MLLVWGAFLNVVKGQYVEYLIGCKASALVHTTWIKDFRRVNL